MLNLCVFIFVIYAVSYSAKVILFGQSGKKHRKACCSAKRATALTNIKPQRCKRSNPNIVKIKQTKSGRMGKAPVRPVIFIYSELWLRFQSKSTAKASRRLLKSADLPLRQGQSRFCLPAKAGLSLQSLTS